MKKLFIGLTLLISISFCSLQAQDSLWAGNFGPTGVSGSVKVVEHWGDSLVIAGAIDGIANSGYTTKEFIIFDKIDRSWKRQTVGPSGTGAEVRALAKDPFNRLIIGGDFTFTTNGRTLAHLAVLDKSGMWNSLTDIDDDGFDGPINALLWHEDKLYIGGEFQNVGSLPAPGFVVWHAVNGFTVPNYPLVAFMNPDPIVHTIQAPSENSKTIYVGGEFVYSANENAAANISGYDVVNSEFTEVVVSPLGPVYAIFTNTSSVWKDKIAFGGAYTEVAFPGGPPIDAKYFTIYNMSDSTYVVPGDSLDAPVFTIKKHKSPNPSWLTVGGEFTAAGESGKGPLAVWWTNYNKWSTFSTLPKGGAVYAIDDSTSFVGGEFKYINDTSIVNNIFELPFPYTTTFKELGDGLNSTNSSNIHVADVEAAGDQRYYACGNFNYAGARLVNYIAMWDGFRWNALGEGLNNTVGELLVDGDTVYVAGSALDSASGVPVNQIAMWDGTQWMAMGEGVPGATILDMEMDTLGNLYVCGSGLYTAGNVAVTGVAMWDGSEWSAVGGPIVSSAALFVFDMYIDTLTNNLYICGQFETVDGVPSPGAAMWDGSEWTAIGNSKLRDLGAPRVIGQAPEGDIIVGGVFNNANLVYLDPPNDWYSYAGGLLSGYPTAMLTSGCDLFISGDNLQYIDNVYVQNFGRWDGFEWVGFEGGTNTDLLAMSKNANSLIMGGEFKLAGGKIAYGFTIWEGIRNHDEVAALSVISPSLNDTLRYGTVFDFKWDTSTTVDLVSFEISYNSGLTWNPLHLNIDSKQGKFPWLVPDSNLNFCKVRISDAEFPCITKQEGGFFSIRGNPEVEINWLTRYGKSYYQEPFTVGYHNWNFGNSRANMWPQSHVDTIYTPILAAGMLHPEKRTFPNWTMFVEAFSPGWTTVGGNVQTPRPRALIAWKYLMNNWGGSCFGFSQTSLLWWIRNYYNTGIFVPQEFEFNFTLNDFYRKVINKHQVYQFGKKHINYVANVHNNKPWETVETVLHGFENKIPMTVSFTWKDWELKEDGKATAADSTKKRSGHNCVPYMVKRFPDTAGIYYMYLADPNFPASDSQYIRIDSAGESWTYPNYPLTEDLRKFFPILPINEFEGTAMSPKISKSVEEEIAFLYTSGSLEILATDSVGNQLGYIDGEEVVTISQGGPIYNYEPELTDDVPLGFAMPPGKYNIELTSFIDSTMGFTFIDDSLGYEYERAVNDSTETDRVSISSSINFVNPDTTMKKISITTIDVNSDNELYAKIDSLSMMQDDSTVVGIDPTGAVKIENFGSEKNYSFLLWYAGSDTSDFTQSLTMINLPANSTQQIEPVWNNLGGGSVEIVIDNDQDGIYEDTIIADAATDIEDEIGQVLPNSYHLAQNYPNPFNPVTTISFNLPTKSDVTLEILNILGQKVKILTEQTLPAGEHQLTWNGNDRSGNKVGSGVYFYRLTADDFVSTKKMLLLK